LIIEIPIISEIYLSSGFRPVLLDP
jgi:hypothetical protein